MKPLLVVMNPRRMRRCLEAISALDVEKTWLVGFWEKGLEAEVDAIVEAESSGRGRGYTHLVMLADDTAPTQAALDLVLGALDDGRPVATGHCNLDETSPLVNITRSPIPPDEDQPRVEHYDWYARAEVEAWPEPIVPTFFAGMALTGMTLEHWRRFPFRVVTRPDEPRGYASDWHLSRRLAAAGVSIAAPRGAFVEHVKERWNDQAPRDPSKRLLVGRIPAEVVFSREAPGLRWAT